MLLVSGKSTLVDVKSVHMFINNDYVDANAIHIKCIFILLNHLMENFDVNLKRAIT